MRLLSRPHALSCTHAQHSAAGLAIPCFRGIGLRCNHFCRPGNTICSFPPWSFASGLAAVRTKSAKRQGEMLLTMPAPSSPLGYQHMMKSREPMKLKYVCAAHNGLLAVFSLAIFVVSVSTTPSLNLLGPTLFYSRKRAK